MASQASGPLVLAVDQGTSATKGLVVDARGEVVARISEAIDQTHPAPGWVEQDPAQILHSVRSVIDRLCQAHPAIAAVGFSTQRESALAWDRSTGAPLSPVLGWQDRRTVAAADRLAPDAAAVRELSGLPISPMFSALKFQWILDQVDPDRVAARDGRIALGTVDSWLLWALTGEHRIEAGNASRTQLLDLARGHWSPELLQIFNIPEQALPDVVASDAGATMNGLTLGAVLGDSHAALYGHGVRGVGDVKVTYGTGSSIMGITDRPVPGPGLVGTIAWRTGTTTTRAFEGNILATGATIAWLANLLDVSPEQVAQMAATVPDSGGVDIVPGFAGLGAPWWDERAMGLVVGVQLGTERAQLARAAFESIALQIEDVLTATESEVGIAVQRVLTDGGPSRNDWLMQLQADISGRHVHRHDSADLSGLGAAMLAAEATGVADSGWGQQSPHTTFAPAVTTDERRRGRWKGALARARMPT
ncbi:MAG: FGGY family carbohydrate kinase [Propioniciclava sp.]